jgi:hypothetical protein
LLRENSGGSHFWTGIARDPGVSGPSSGGGIVSLMLQLLRPLVAIKHLASGVLQLPPGVLNLSLRLFGGAPGLSLSFANPFANLAFDSPPDVFQLSLHAIHIHSFLLVLPSLDFRMDGTRDRFARC